VPVYVFSCPVCNGQNELLLKLGDTGPRPCPTPDCPGTATQRFSRVAVRYDSFGFTTTDNLVADPRGKDFQALRKKAEEISDSSK
jgi:predicted nucleic acid-binding Zn ribbon protein